MRCFQLESAQTELTNFTSDVNGIQITLMGGKKSQLETHLEIPVIEVPHKPSSKVPKWTLLVCVLHVQTLCPEVSFTVF